MKYWPLSLEKLDNGKNLKINLKDSISPVLIEDMSDKNIL